MSENESESESGAVLIEVSGNPHPQPRPRWVAGQGMVSTMGPRVKAWRMRLAEAIAQAVADLGEAEFERFNNGAVGLVLEFRIPVEAKNAKWVGLFHHKTPDTDNLAKPVMDELTNAKVLPDDGRIAELVVRKRWCRPQDAGLTMTLARVPAPRGLELGEWPGWLSGWAEDEADATQGVAHGPVTGPGE